MSDPITNEEKNAAWEIARKALEDAKKKTDVKKHVETTNVTFPQQPAPYFYPFVDYSYIPTQNYVTSFPGVPPFYPAYPAYPPNMYQQYGAMPNMNGMQPPLPPPPPPCAPVLTSTTAGNETSNTTKTPPKSSADETYFTNDQGESSANDKTANSPSSSSTSFINNSSSAQYGGYATYNYSATNSAKSKQAPGSGGIKFNLPKRQGVPNNAPLSNNFQKVRNNNKVYQGSFQRNDELGNGQDDPKSPKSLMVGSMVIDDDWPESFKNFVERSYARCKTSLDKDQVVIVLKGKLIKAQKDGTLRIKDWEKEPLPGIHSEQTKQQQQPKVNVVPTPTFTPKLPPSPKNPPWNNRSVEKRRRSRSSSSKSPSPEREITRSKRRQTSSSGSDSSDSSSTAGRRLSSSIVGPTRERGNSNRGRARAGKSGNNAGNKKRKNKNKMYEKS